MGRLTAGIVPAGFVLLLLDYWNQRLASCMHAAGSQRLASYMPNGRSRTAGLRLGGCVAIDRSADCGMEFGCITAEKDGLLDGKTGTESDFSTMLVCFSFRKKKEERGVWPQFSLINNLRGLTLTAG